MKIEMVPVEKIIPYVQNPKAHPEAQIKKLAGAIAEFKWDQPIVVDRDMVIIKGHGRLQAAQALGIKEVPVVVADYLTPAQVKAARIADNKVAESEWFPETLALELQALNEMDFDLSLTGFDPDELEGMGIGQIGEVPEDPGPQIDRAAELQEKWGTALGQIWQVGRHRVMCGDSTSAEDVGRLLKGKKPNLMVTDPPYGVALDQSWRDKALGDKAMGPGNKNIVSNDDRSDWTDVWKLFSGDVAYIWHAGRFSDVVMASLRAADFEICQQLIWNKSIMVMGRSDYHFKHEPCWYAVRMGKTHGWIGDHKQTTVIEAKSPNHIMSGSDEEKTDHPTQKPIECMAYMIKNHSGDVYDPFLGSGTTLIAAEQLGRICYGMEIAREYVAVILERALGIGLEPKLIEGE